VIVGWGRRRRRRR